jgi:glycosyltransferase involved in cell wall biosynthesis
MNIAVFIPAYNASKTIYETLEGINISAFTAGIILPVFVYDDFSSDNTLEVLKSFKADNIQIYIHQNKKNLGERATINHAFSEFGKQFHWVYLIHADDIPKPDWIQAINKVIYSCNNDTIFTVWSSFDSLIEIDKSIIEGDNEGTVVINNRSSEDANIYLTKITSSWHVSGAAINLKLFNLIGGFDSLLPQYGDTDFFVRGFLNGFSDIYIRKTLTFYRIIQSSVSSVSRNTNRDIKEMIYLSDKFQKILSKQQRRRIFKKGFKLAVKRVAKETKSGNFKSAMQNSKMLALVIKKAFF